MFHTGPNQPPQRLQLGSWQLTKISVGPMDNNAYLLTDSTGLTVLIDAADQAEKIQAELADKKLAMIITTHRHADHIQALAQLATENIKLIAGADDCQAIATQTGIKPEPVADGDVINIGQLQLEVIGLVGHTPGSIALVARPADGAKTHIFTGDSLFPGGVGKTNSPADFNSLYRDVTTKIFDRFDDQTVIHPGHGDATTLGAERGQLAEWKARGW